MTRSMLSLFWVRIGVHMSGLLFASRTVDEKPPEARSKICFSSFSLSRTVSARAKDVTWEMWDIYAVWTSWLDEFMYIVLILRASYSCSIVLTAFGSDSWLSQMMHA